MNRPQRRFSPAALDTGEGFIDVLFLLLTFFIVQNVWQLAISEAHKQVIHDTKIDLVKATGPPSDDRMPKDDAFLQVIVGDDFVEFEKGGIIADRIVVFQSQSNRDEQDIEYAVFKATEKASIDVLHQSSYRAEEILVRLYFERTATIMYAAGVYDALTKTGFDKFQWGLRSSKKGIGLCGEMGEMVAYLIFHMSMAHMENHII